MSGLFSVTDSLFTKCITYGCWRDKTTLNELVGKVYQIPGDCVDDCGNITGDHSDDICIIVEVDSIIKKT